MSQGPAVSSLVRVTVASGTRRVDLVLPGAVPLAEILPELARSVGLLDPFSVHAGYRVVTTDGRELAGDGGLIAQGVEDGGLLTLSSKIDDEPSRLYDDVVEAMTDAVECALQPWTPAAGRRAALVAAALLLALGATALLLDASREAGAGAALAAGLLAVGGVVLSRVHGEHETGVALTWVAAGYAAAAGTVLADAGSLLGPPAAGAGAGVLLVGLGALVGLRVGRALALPAVVLGALLLSAGLAVALGGLEPEVVMATTLTLVVAAGSAFPGLALSATGVRVDEPHSSDDVHARPDPIALDRIVVDARFAHDLLVGLYCSVGLLLVLATPYVVSLGVAGAVLALLCCAAVTLRTRHHRTHATVLVGLASGIAGLVTGAASVLWFHPGWRASAAVALAAAGSLVLAAGITRVPGSVRWGRLADAAEVVALLALLPTLLVAAGAVSAVRG